MSRSSIPPLSPDNLPAKLKRFARALSLLWGRLGSARIYVALVAGLIIALAALGVWHIYSWRKQAELTRDRTPATASITETPTAGQTSGKLRTNASPANQFPSQTPAIPSASQVTGGTEQLVAITDVRQAKRRGRRGEIFVIATIGMAPRSKVEKDDIEIHVSFFDVTPANEMRPTDAQVTYQWLTPVRDWNDPAPKYLAATYLKPRKSRRSSEKLRYGGFIVQVYAGGTLQDERSEPERLLSFLHSGGKQETLPQSPTRGTTTSVPFTPGEVASPEIEKKAAANTSTPLAIVSPSPEEKRVSKDETLPYGKPVPGKPGFVSSPFDSKFIIDVRGFPPGTLVNDPNTGKAFRIP
jgi:hypothetical protein